MNHKQIAEKYGITEGPWYTSKPKSDDCIDVNNGSGGCFVCTVEDDKFPQRDLEQDASCISLLPELLAAAEETINWFGPNAECRALNDVLKRMRGE